MAYHKGAIHQITLASADEPLVVDGTLFVGCDDNAWIGRVEVIRLASVGGGNTGGSRAAMDIRPSRGVGLVRINMHGSSSDGGDGSDGWGVGEAASLSDGAYSGGLEIRGSLLVTPLVGGSGTSWSYWRIEVNDVALIDGATRFDAGDAMAGEFVVNTKRVRSTASIAEGGAAATAAATRCAGTGANAYIQERTRHTYSSNNDIAGDRLQRRQTHVFN